MQPARDTGGQRDLLAKPFGQSLGKLHDGNERQLCGSLGWRSVLWKQVGEVRISVDRAKRVAHAHVGVAFGEGGTRDPRRMLEQEEVDVAQPEVLDGLVEGLQSRTVGVGAVVELAGDEDIAAVEP